MADQAQGILSPWLRRMRFNVAQPHLHGKILDLGCGVGELCNHVAPDNYFGVDRDIESITIARERHPGHTFETEIPKDLSFDTIVLLAVIEHIKTPLDFLADLKGSLKPGGNIVLTTPHPLADGIHTAGAKIGLFSSDANEEHETLINYKTMEELAASAKLRITHFKKFQLGLNQLFVLNS